MNYNSYFMDFINIILIIIIIIKVPVIRDTFLILYFFNLQIKCIFFLKLYNNKIIIYFILFNFLKKILL